jgi:nitroreductase
VLIATGPVSEPDVVLGVIEAMETCPAIRRFKPEPVPNAVIERVVFAATRAPSPSNSQRWAFVVVRDPAVKRRIADLTAPTAMGNIRRLLSSTTSDRQGRMLRSSMQLAESLADVPVLLFVCATGIDRSSPIDPRVWLGVMPAAQNALLAARSVGLGTTLGTYHLHDEKGVAEVLGLPPDVLIAATIVMGWPAVPFSRVNRRPIDEVLRWDRW